MPPPPPVGASAYMIGAALRLSSLRRNSSDANAINTNPVDRNSTCEARGRGNYSLISLAPSPGVSTSCAG